MKYKDNNYNIALLLMITLSCCCISYAGELHGKIKLKTKDGVIIQEGTIFVGEADFLPAVNFPVYLKAMASSMVSQKKVSIKKDGSFFIPEVQEKKDLIVGISFLEVDYFIRINLKEGEKLELNRILDLTLLQKDTSVKVLNKTGKVFESGFAEVSYLIQNGLEGWVFKGFKKNDGEIEIKDVVLGNYTFFVLNEEGVGANRVDSMQVSLTPSSSPNVTFEIK